MIQPELIRIGWREYVALPDLGIAKVAAKIDTGARTSSLHAYDINEYEENGIAKVHFRVDAHFDLEKISYACHAKLMDKRRVKSSIGKLQHRCVIETLLVIGKRRKKIEITLTDRTKMKYDVLIGRAVLEKEYLVNPSASYYLGDPDY